LPSQHEVRYHTIWNTKHYISNDNAVTKPSSSHYDGCVNEEENHFIDALEGITPSATFNKLINQGETGENA
jgi:hypothetical protein